MKIQIDLDQQLWNDFKTKVQGDGKTLREVVPTVFEPALKAYLEPPPVIFPTDSEIDKAVVPQSHDVPSAYQESVKRITTPPIPQVKRCDLCDMPTPRTFNHKGRKVCYTCWRDGIINDATSKTSLPEAPTSSAS